MKRKMPTKCIKSIFVFTFSFIFFSRIFSLETVSLQLKWTHAFQFAGYYAALEKGYYRDAGMDVEIREAEPEINPTDEVLSGRATYGIGTSGILLERAEGNPLVVLSVIFQHSALAIVARMDNPSQTIHDLLGCTIMLEHQSEELQIYLANQGLPKNDLIIEGHSLSLMDLVNKKVDAMSVYTTSEPYFLDKMQFNYFLYTPRSIGIDFYGDNLFTTEEEVKLNPQRTKAFREASLRGWLYALENQDEIIDLILNKYSKFLSRDFLQYEAEHMIPLIRTDLVELGYMNKGRWQHIADTYAEQGMLERNFHFGNFIYEPNPTFDPRGLYVALGILFLLIIIITTVSFYVSRVNIRLNQTMDKYKTAVQNLAESEKKYRYIAENSSDVIWVLDIEKSQFLYISPSVEKLRGFTPEEVMSETMEKSVSPETKKNIDDLITQNLAQYLAGERSVYVTEMEQPCKKGGTIWTEATIRFVRDEESGKMLIYGTTRDISERRYKDERIRHMAEHDGLTDLPNRTLFFNRLHQVLAFARRDNTTIALLYIDLDKFKEVNDTFGHGVGDLLLKEVADRIKRCIRETDTAGRIGGDEFILFLRNPEFPEGVIKVAEKIRSELERIFCISDYEIHISSSIGIALFPTHGESEEILSLHADNAMYEAKKAGRNRVCLYNQSR